MNGGGRLSTCTPGPPHAHGLNPQQSQPSSLDSAPPHSTEDHCLPSPVPVTIPLMSLRKLRPPSKKYALSFHPLAPPLVWGWDPLSSPSQRLLDQVTASGASRHITEPSLPPPRDLTSFITSGFFRDPLPPSIIPLPLLLKRQNKHKN